MPAITRKYIRANVYKTIVDLCHQIESLRRLVDIKQGITKSEILRLLAQAQATASEARALLRISVAEVKKELQDVTEE